MLKDRFFRIMGILAVTSLIAFAAAWLTSGQLPWHALGQVVHQNDQNWQAVSDETFSFGPAAVLEVSNPVGSISVSGSAQSDITVEVVRKARAGTTTRAERLLEEITITTDVNPDRTHIAAHVPNSLQAEQVQVDFVIRAPFEQAMEIQAAIGSVKLQDLTGRFDVRAKIGSIEGDNLGGQGSFSAEMGAIRLHRSHFDQYLHFNSAMGAIEFEGTPAVITTADTQMGSITLDLDSQGLYEVRAETTMGSVRTQLAFNGSQTDRSLEGLLGRGSEVQARLELSSRMGSIQIK